MRKLLLIAIAAALPISALADPVPIDNTVSPCDSSSSTSKPSCNTDSDSVAVPPPMPSERKSVIVPPEIPAEGLPDRSKKPGADVHQPTGPSKQ